MFKFHHWCERKGAARSWGIRIFATLQILGSSSELESPGFQAHLSEVLQEPSSVSLQLKATSGQYPLSGCRGLRGAWKVGAKVLKQPTCEQREIGVGCFMWRIIHYPLILGL